MVVDPQKNRNNSHFKIPPQKLLAFCPWFHKTFIVSGTVFCPTNCWQHPVSFAKHFGNNNGINGLPTSVVHPPQKENDTPKTAVIYIYIQTQIYIYIQTTTFLWFFESTNTSPNECARLIKLLLFFPAWIPKVTSKNGNGLLPGFLFHSPFFLERLSLQVKQPGRWESEHDGRWGFYCRYTVYVWSTCFMESWVNFGFFWTKQPTCFFFRALWGDESPS